MQRPARVSPEHDPVPIRPVPIERADVRLPMPPTRFLGRESEVAAVCDMIRVDDARLVTLIGPGGVGKTRLAIEVAKTMAPAFPDGARFAALARVRDSSLVASEISRVADDRVPAPGHGEDAAVAALRTFEGLLVLDNFEHVVASAPLLAELLDACPGLVMLVTSRTMLRLSAERMFFVPPLTVPAGVDRADVDALEQLTAVRLFVDRARSQRHDFALTPANAGTIAAICDAVDGLPLSIVLAAAHIDLMTPDSLLERLRRRMPLLDRGPRDAPDRHRSVDAAIGWSYDLLDAAAQSAFRRLAVFLDSFTLDAAEAMLGGVALETISALVNSSLVAVAQTPDGQTRYAMLEPIREHALERLAGGDGETTAGQGRATSDEEVAARDRHAEHFGEIADWSDWVWFMERSQGGPRIARLAAEIANIRAALDWLHRRGDHVSLLRMAASLGGLWIVLGHPREGIRWLEAGLDGGSDIPDPVRARSLATLSWCTNTAGDPVRALALAEESLAILRGLNEPVYLGKALILSGVAAYRVEGRQQDAEAWFEEAQEVLAPVAAPEWVPNMRAMVSGQLGHAALIRGDIARAEASFRGLRENEASRGFELGTSYIYATMLPLAMADLARATGDATNAHDLYRTALALSRRNRNQRGLCHALSGVAGALAALGEFVVAAKIFGACEVLHEQLGYDFAEMFDRQRAFGLPEPWLREEHGFGDWQRFWDAERGRRSLPPVRNLAAAAEAWTDGREMPLDAAIDLALDVDPHHVMPGDVAAPAGLSERELEVLRLLVDGMTDVEIAEALYISRRTAATHIRHIYDKAGVSSRAQAAAWAVRNGIA